MSNFAAATSYYRPTLELIHQLFIKLVRSDYKCTVDGAGIVPYKVTKCRCTKAFKSTVRVG